MYILSVRCYHVPPDLPRSHHERPHRPHAGLGGSVHRPPRLQGQPETDRRRRPAPQVQAGRSAGQDAGRPPRLHCGQETRVTPTVPPSPLYRRTLYFGLFNRFMNKNTFYI